MSYLQLIHKVLYISISWISRNLDLFNLYEECEKEEGDLEKLQYLSLTNQVFVSSGYWKQILDHMPQGQQNIHFEYHKRT